MPRPPRIKVTNLLFHIMNRGNGRQCVFHTNDSYKEFYNLLRRYKNLFPIKIYHYVLMPNHFHLLVESSDETAISKFMQRVSLSHTRRYNLKNYTVGHLWQGRFKSILVETGEYYLQCGRYIDLNPVRAKLVEHPSEWRWCSYGALADGRKDVLVDAHPLYIELGKSEKQRQKHYRQFVALEISASKSNESMRFSEKYVYGNEAFVERMKTDYYMIIPRPNAGRPKNQN